MHTPHSDSVGNDRCVLPVFRWRCWNKFLRNAIPRNCSYNINGVIQSTIIKITRIVTGYGQPLSLGHFGFAYKKRTQGYLMNGVFIGFARHLLRGTSHHKGTAFHFHPIALKGVFDDLQQGILRQPAAAIFCRQPQCHIALCIESMNGGNLWGGPPISKTPGISSRPNRGIGELYDSSLKQFCIHGIEAKSCGQQGTGQGCDQTVRCCTLPQQ